MKTIEPRSRGHHLGVALISAGSLALVGIPALVRTAAATSCTTYEALELCAPERPWGIPDVVGWCDTPGLVGYRFVKRTCGGAVLPPPPCDGCQESWWPDYYCGGSLEGCNGYAAACVGQPPPPEAPVCGASADACDPNETQSCEPDPDKVPQFGQRPDDGGANTCSEDLDRAGDDPISIPARAAVTEPFADFESQALAKLALSRTYSSADVSVRSGGSPGVFGPGWRHDWEAELSCRQIGSGFTSTTCRIAIGLAEGMSFASNPVVAPGIGAYSAEQWTTYSRSDVLALGTGDRSILARRQRKNAAGAWAEAGWIAFLADGRELHFQTFCDTCGPSNDPYCQDPLGGGKARLARVVDAKGNAVDLSYDRPVGVLLSLTDSVTGHALALRQPSSACSESQARTLEYDGVVYASYEYSGSQLWRVHLGDISGPVLRSYEYDSARPAYLRTVKNAAGDPVVEFGYDANGWATHVQDRSSTIDVSYADTSTVRLVSAAARAASTTQARGGGGRVSSLASGSGLSYYAWLVNKYLRCKEDAARRVHWYDRDIQGRILRHRQYAAGVVSCQSTVPGSATPELDESFEYGLSKPVAEGISVDLTKVTKVHRRSVLADQVTNSADKTTFDTISDYGSEYSSWDPSGYACTVAPLAVGSVRCRFIEDGLTKDINGTLVREQRATFYSYDAHGRLTKTIGPMTLGNPSDSAIPVEERTYWADVGETTTARRGRLREVKRYPSRSSTSPHVTTYDWDTFGPFQIVDPNGRTTLLVHDSRGRIVARVTPDGRSLSFRYHDETSPRLVVFNDGTTVRYQYDDKGRVKAVQPLSGDPEGPGSTVSAGWTQLVTYDPAGNTSQIAVADADGIVRWLRQQEYDPDHRLLADIHPEGTGVASWGYDPSGLLTTYTDEEGKITQVDLDGLGRPKTVRRKRQGPVGWESLDLATYTFDAAGQGLTSVTDARGGVTAYEQDDFGGVLSVGNSGTFKTSPWRYAYDARGAVSRRFDGMASTSYLYDALGRLTQLSALNQADAEQIQYAYQYDRPGDVGRLAAIVEASRTTEFTYDEVGRLLTETVREGVAAPLTTGYAWDANGYLSTLSYPTGLQVVYARDPVTKTIAEVRNAASGTTYASNVSYWPAGPLRHVTFGNGAELATSYNLRYEPRSLASGPIALGYEPMPAGNIGAVTSDATRTTFGYDILDRLVALSTDTSALRYEYAGDRVIAAYTKGPPDTLLYAFGYDSQSNLSAISVYDSSGTTITQTLCLKHDALGRLVLFGRTAPGNGGPDRLACRSTSEVTEVIARFEYDARNRRVARNTAATGLTTEYVFFPDGRHAAELTRPATASEPWAALRDYVWLQDIPLAQVERALDGQNGRPHYFHVDHVGLPRALTGPSGEIVWRAEARPYGDVAEQSGATVVTNLRLPGQYDERLFAAAGISGMQGPYYNWNRWYLPSMGRYMEPDPIALAGGFNTEYGVDWYGYATQNPLLNSDPTGLTDRSQLCESLANRIQNIEKKIAQRIGELDEDPQGLPETCAGDKQNPSLSRSGHRMLINKDKAQLAVLKAQYALMCGNFGPPPFSNPFPFQPPATNPYRQNQSPQTSPMVPAAGTAGALGTAAVILLIIILLPVGM